MTTEAIELMPHQRQGVDLSRKKPRFAFFWKPGTGKTMTILSIWKERPMRTVVVAQRSIINTAWRKDAAALGVPCVIAYESNKRKREALLRTPGNVVIVTNYEQFKANAKLLLETGVERAVFDESSKLKNRAAQITVAAINFSDYMKEVYLLSGTPAPNCTTELWSQLRVLHPNAAGRNFFQWAYAWFVPEMQFVRGKKVIKGWKMKSGLEDRFNVALKEWAWALRKEDCIKLPPPGDEIINVTLSESEADAYLRAIDEMRILVPNSDVLSEERELPVAIEGVSMKLRQIAGGCVLVEGKRVEVGSSKLTALTDLIEELGDEQCVIWCEFTHEIDRVVGHLRHLGKSVEYIDGRTSHVCGDIVDRFVAKTTQYVVAHPAAAGHGTDGLQKVCKYAVYYSLSYSAEKHEQSRDRLHRKGQNNHVTFYYLIAEGTLDEGLLMCVRKKATRQDALLRELNRR